jgi:hypothetical protein
VVVMPDGAEVSGLNDSGTREQLKCQHSQCHRGVQHLSAVWHFDIDGSWWVPRTHSLFKHIAKSPRSDSPL